MSALFISQVLGLHLNLGQQLVVILTSIFASVGLPKKYIALLLTVDWFLDRCRTTINVMDDMTVSALLDGKKPHLFAIKM